MKQYDLTGSSAAGVQRRAAEVPEPGPAEDQLHPGRGRQGEEGRAHRVQRRQGDSGEAAATAARQTTTAAATVVGPTAAAAPVRSPGSTGRCTASADQHHSG